MRSLAGLAALGLLAACARSQTVDLPEDAGPQDGGAAPECSPERAEFAGLAGPDGCDPAAYALPAVPLTQDEIAVGPCYDRFREPPRSPFVLAGVDVGASTCVRVIEAASGLAPDLTPMGSWLFRPQYAVLHDAADFRVEVVFDDGCNLRRGERLVRGTFPGPQRLAQEATPILAVANPPWGYATAEEVVLIHPLEDGEVRLPSVGARDLIPRRDGRSRFAGMWIEGAEDAPVLRLYSADPERDVAVAVAPGTRLLPAYRTIPGGIDEGILVEETRARRVRFDEDLEALETVEEIALPEYDAIFFYGDALWLEVEGSPRVWRMSTGEEVTPEGLEDGDVITYAGPGLAAYPILRRGDAYLLLIPDVRDDLGSDLVRSWLSRGRLTPAQAAGVGALLGASSLGFNAGNFFNGPLVLYGENGAVVLDGVNLAAANPDAFFDARERLGGPIRIANHGALVTEDPGGGSSLWDVTPQVPRFDRLCTVWDEE